MWVCETEDGAHFVRGDRYKAMDEKIFGPELVGVLVADRCAAGRTCCGL